MEEQLMYKINDDCINCGACVPECPVDAIKEEGGKYLINEDCIDCGACEGACPVDAIKAV
jgi:ferredoxin